MRLNHTKIGLWLCLAILAICLAATTIYHPLQQDEGVFLTIGQNLSRGYLPYRDFFDHKPPGIHWLFAAIYYVFGNNVLWYKIVLILTNLASAWLVYKIAIIVFYKITPKRGLRKGNFQDFNQEQQTKVCSLGQGAQALAWRNTLKRGLQNNVLQT